MDSLSKLQLQQLIMRAGLDQRRIGNPTQRSLSWLMWIVFDNIR